MCIRIQVDVRKPLKRKKKITGRMQLILLSSVSMNGLVISAFGVD